MTDPHGQPPRGVAGSVAKAAYYLGGFTLGYLWQVRRRLVRSTLIVFDRYAHDFEVDPKRFRYGGPQSIAKFVRLMAPRPDLVILLDAPPNVLWGRKPELPREEFARLNERYRTIVASLPNGHVIDATLPVPEVAARVEAVVLRFMAERIHGRMRARAVNMPRHIALNSEAP